MSIYLKIHFKIFTNIDSELVTERDMYDVCVSSPAHIHIGIELKKQTKNKTKSARLPVSRVYTSCVYYILPTGC